MTVEQCHEGPAREPGDVLRMVDLEARQCGQRAAQPARVRRGQHEVGAGTCEIAHGIDEGSGRVEVFDHLAGHDQVGRFEAQGRDSIGISTINQVRVVASRPGGFHTGGVDVESHEQRRALSETSVKPRPGPVLHHPAARVREPDVDDTPARSQLDQIRDAIDDVRLRQSLDHRQLVEVVRVHTRSLLILQREIHSVNETGVRLFETLFPLIVPGGSYVIERWSWEHFVLESMLAGADATDGPTIEEQRVEAVQRLRAIKGEVLEAIVSDLVEAVRSRPGVVAGVTASRYWLEVRRGPDAVEPSTFRLRSV